MPFARRVQIVRGDQAIASLARKAGIGAATPIALGAGDARVSPKAVCKLEAHLKDWAAAGGRVVKAAAILLLVVFAPGGCVRMPDGRLVPWGKA